MVGHDANPQGRLTGSGFRVKGLCLPSPLLEPVLAGVGAGVEIVDKLPRQVAPFAGALTGWAVRGLDYEPMLAGFSCH